MSEAKRLAEGDAETLGRLNASGALTPAFVDMLGVGDGAQCKGPSAPGTSRSAASRRPSRPGQMQQVMQLTPAQLAQLPPDRRPPKIEEAGARTSRGRRGTTQTDRRGY